MATQDEIFALVHAHINNNHEYFRDMVLAIAANSEKASPKFARELRRLSEKAPQTVAQFVALHPDMTSLLSMSHPTVKLEDMILDRETRFSIDRVLQEHIARDRLVKHNLSPMRKLLFVGPPGVGKTMGAQAIASAMSLPLFRVEMSGLIDSYLGNTSKNISKVFAHIGRMNGVYLFDEFDAIASERGGANDHGEMRRVVNVLLQLIEDDKSDSLIIAATNHHGILDRAIYRRFDMTIAFPLPTKELAEALIRRCLLWADGIKWLDVKDVAGGVGHADLTVACDRVNKDDISTMDLVAAIRERRIPD